MTNHIQKILDANERLKGIAKRTPVLESSSLNEEFGANIFFKCENFQHIGAFKFRGAFNAISQLSEQQKQKGVIAYSSGNHAQAVAMVGKMLNINTTIVMPNNVPKIKETATREQGAKVVIFDPLKHTREEIAERENPGEALTLIKPFDNENVLAGQGTVAYEFIEQVGNLDTILAPCGGGGLLSGTAIATKHCLPDCKIIGVEPELADDATRSFYTGVLQSNPNPPTIADGTRTTCMGTITFPLVREYVDEMKTVSEVSIKDAVKYFFYKMKIVVEPSGALGLAAIMSGKIKTQGRVGVILSGGNIDGKTMSDIFQE